MTSFCERRKLEFDQIRLREQLAVVAARSLRTGKMERRFKSFMWMTRRTWSRKRRTDTIDYVVTDHTGLTSTSTRTVIIQPDSRRPQ
jgi:hypothetical protein